MCLVIVAVPARSASPNLFPGSLPSQNQTWLTHVFSQRSVLSRPQLLSFDNHLNCLCFCGKMRLSDRPSSPNPSRIRDFRAGCTTKLPLVPNWEKATSGTDFSLCAFELCRISASPRPGRNPQVAGDEAATGTVFFAAGLLRMINAPATHTAPPSIEIHATCSLRKITPSISASAGIKNAADEARVAPNFPAEIDMIANAMPVLSTPSASSAASGPGAHLICATSRNPIGATSTSATNCARKITGNAPFRCCSGLARFSATPYETSAAKIIPTPATVLRPSCNVGNAITTAPAMPIAMPVITRRDGSLHAINAATTAVNNGFAPFNIPVSAEETYRSANGNMLSGNAIQNAPSATIFSQSERSTGWRAAGKHKSVRNPTASRTNVTPPGPIAPSASAINRYDAPQINPGSERITQSAAPDRRSAPAAIVVEFVSFAMRVSAGSVSAGRRISAITTQTKSHFGEPRWPALLKQQVASAKRLTFVCERIKDGNREMAKVAGIARCDGQPMNARRRRDHGVDDQGIRCFLRNSAPLSEAVFVHRQYLMRRGKRREPALQALRARRILRARLFNSNLQLANRDSRNKYLLRSDARNPGHHAAVWPRFASLGNDVGIEQVRNQSNSTGARNLYRVLLGNGISKRGSGARRISLRVGRSFFCDCCHSSKEITTAVSTPRLVTICGPFATASSTTLLNFAFASWSCHLAIGFQPPGHYMTSQLTSQVPRSLTPLRSPSVPDVLPLPPNEQDST